MSYYRLISSLPDVQQHLEAIDKIYFSAQVKHLDGNTVQINKVYYINPEYLEQLASIIVPGTELYLERLKYITKFTLAGAMNDIKKNYAWKKMIYPAEIKQMSMEAIC